MLVQATNSKVLDALWFTSRKCLGIVLTENEIGERKFYIGEASGLDVKADMIDIADNGSPFSPEVMIRFLAQERKI